MRQKLELEVDDVFTTSVDSLGGGGGGGTLSSSAKKINLSIRSRNVYCLIRCLNPEKRTITKKIQNPSR